jgi:eukaryotic-like serine/threonine-protein kinase
LNSTRSGLAGLDTERWRRVEVVLDRALDMPPDQVQAWLDEACAGDADLRARVEGLLATDRSAAGFLERPVAEIAPDLLRAEEPPDGEPAGRRIGAWRLLREVGRGGMGTVHLAERADEQFEQLVAMKLVRRGLDTDEILLRFVRERRILARLEHKNIARLVDGGVTEDGLPWFAMEYVEGEPITTWCATRRLAIDDRLRLFRSACEAVQYAHGRLVVHRDLKPSNVFVTRDGEVKLLDFGIARLIRDEADRARDDTLTVGEVLPLTPRYAAPEQILGEPAGTTTDIYGLGLLMYEVLTEVPPRPRDLDPEQLRRMILEGDPTPPSVARPEWRDRLRGDIDHIVLMALRRDPERRYGSVEALIADLDRFRDGLPVRAAPPSAGDRIAKFVRRNRAAVIVATVTIVALFVGLIAAMWQAVAAGIVIASLAGVLAVSMWQTRAARHEAHKSAEIRRFLMNVFEVSDPSRSLGQSVTARELLDRGVSRIERELRAQPELRAQMMGVFGDLHVKLGLADPGLKLVDRELELLAAQPRARSRDRGSALRRRGDLLLLKGDWARAESALREAVEQHQRDPGEGSPELAEDLDQLAVAVRLNARPQESEALFRRAHDIRRRVFGKDHSEVAVSLNNLAIMAREAGRLDEAEALHRECIRIRRERLDPDHPGLCQSLGNLAVLLRQRGRFDEAERTAREALAMHRRVYGDDHPLTAGVLNTLGALTINLARYEEAASIFEALMAFWARRESRGHPNAVASLNNLAVVRREQGDLQTAEALQREAVEGWRSLLGERHPYLAAGLVNLAAVHREQERFEDAERLLRQALEIRLESRGEDHLETADVRFHAGMLAERRGDLSAAETDIRGALEIRTRHLGEGSPDTEAARVALAAILRRTGRVAEAEPLLGEALSRLRATFSQPHPDIGRALLELGLVLRESGRVDEAGAAFAEAVEVLGHVFGPAHPRVAEARAVLSEGRV